MIPRACDSVTMTGAAAECGMDPFVILPARSTYVDQQTLKLQVWFSLYTFDTSMQSACKLRELGTNHVKHHLACAQGYVGAFLLVNIRTGGP